MPRFAGHAALVVALVAACPATAGVSVVDDSQRTITLARPAQRIISLAPHATELLFGAGAGRQVVGVTEFSDFPQAARRLPRVGSSRGLDLEQIVAARPDLVIAWQSGNSAAQVERIEKLGIPVFRSEPKTLDDVARTLERFGVLTGHAEPAREAARRFSARIQALRQAYAGRRPVRVFYQVWKQPLMTIGGPHVISDVMTLCGASNVFAQLDTPGPTVNIEAVVAADPQLIVGGAANGGDVSDLRMWQRWPQIAAVRNGRYTVLDAALITRHTERLAQGAEQLCEAIDATRNDRPN